MRRMRLSAVEDVVERIERSPLSLRDKERMLRRPTDLSLSDSSKLYNKVKLRLEEPIGKRNCRVDWKHQKDNVEIFIGGTTRE